MAHGLAIRTTTGLVNIANEAVRSARLIHKHSATGASGSVTVNEFSKNAGFYHARVTNTSLLPQLYWDEAIHTMSWDSGFGFETVPAFDIYFFRCA